MKTSQPLLAPAAIAAALLAPLGCGEEPRTSRAAESGDAGAAGAQLAEGGGGASSSSEAGSDTGARAAAGGQRCVSALEPSFRLAFEEVALEEEPEELTDLKFVPGESERLLLLDKQGRLRLYELAGSSATLIDKLQVAEVFGEDDCGAVSLALDPGYAENHFAYVGHCLSGTASRITRLTLQEPFEAALASAQTIIEVGDPSATRPWHNVGSIGFDDDLVMWALFGEKTVRDSAQDPSVGLGKLLRTLPSRDPELGGYEAAADNDPSATDPSIYALGLRSPWKGARDAEGRYWVADVGGNTAEELNLITAPGQNLGWPQAEGPCQDGCRGLSDPLLSYGRAPDASYAQDDSETFVTAARAIWVAGPFAGDRELGDPYDCNLRDLMLFGDFFTGWVRAAALDPSGALAIDQPLAHLRLASGFAQDARGVLYATTLGIYKNHGMDPRGRIYRAVAQQE